MPREPFQGSEWGERTPGTQSDPGPGRGRRALPVVLGVLALAVAGFGAANLGADLTLAGDAGKLEMAAGAIVKPVERIHTAQRERIRRALNAPVVLGIPRERLDAIAECESGGDPRAKSADGLYRGKYQFHRGTWASVGGVGDPARASELEQDRRAAMLIKQSGSNPWPVCG